ncbi:probable dynactin subunit 2 [Fopius arisanus]|uniref:Probable dynactin subunit 2 n=1 Tax=Fopius arisanus TaxID=64838 RepID=A0A9R1U4Q3_9HYME|nr:PREDICTED: probable dynactin subunit 2 [Fopius arisanus]
MADSKYADLPGIAYNQVDVYETTDLPESDQFSTYSEDESEAIEKLHINATEAFGKFKGKHVVTTGVDFSDRISIRNRTGFGVWELPGDGEKETPMHKYQRLQCEIKELYDEVSQIKEKAQQKEEERNAADILSHVEEAGKQLNSLKLYDCLGADLVTTLMDPQGGRLKQLETQIEQFKSAGIPDKERTGAPGEADGAKGVLKYEMMYLPEKARMQEVARVSNLEQRLAKLESVIGTSDDKLSKFTQNFKSQGIAESVQKLAAKSSLLDSSQIEAMENRISVLAHRMDAVAQKKSAISPEADRDQKISEMYEIM